MQNNGLSVVREWWDIGAALVVGIASAAFTYARITARMNGLGRRVKQVEGDQSNHDERMHAIENEQGRSAQDRQQLHEEVAAALKAADASQEASELARTAIVGAVHTMQIEIVREMSALRTSMGERMTAVETIVGLMHQPEPRTRRRE